MAGYSCVCLVVWLACLVAWMVCCLVDQLVCLCSWLDLWLAVIWLAGLVVWLVVCLAVGWLAGWFGSLVVLSHLWQGGKGAPA